MLSSCRNSNQISQYILITAVTLVVGLNDYLITAHRSAFYLGFIGSSISASSNCLSISANTWRSPHLFTSCCNPLHIKGCAAISHLHCGCAHPCFTPRKQTCSAQTLALPRDSSKKWLVLLTVQVVPTHRGLAGALAHKWHFLAPWLFAVIVHMKNTIFHIKYLRVFV